MHLKSLKDFIREQLRSELLDSEDQFHIIITFNKSQDILPDLIMNEGIWKPSGYKGYWHRLDIPKFDHEQLHVHIARQKHINTKSKQVAWNKDTSRHDKKSFNDNFNGLEKAKKIARNVLKLPKDTTLENLIDFEKGQLLLEDVQDLPQKSDAYIFKAINKNKPQIIKS